MNEWARMIRLLSNNPEDASGELDWAIKQNYMREHCGGDFSNPKTRFANFLYHEISERGIYNTLVRKQKARRFATAEEIMHARNNPPDTRAEFRTRYIKAAYPIKHDHVSVGWAYFSGDGMPLAICDPLQKTSENGERVLEYLREKAKNQGS